MESCLLLRSSLPSPSSMNDVQAPKSSEVVMSAQPTGPACLTVALAADPAGAVASPAGVGAPSLRGLLATPPPKEETVVLILGATGTGKSRLSVDLAAHFPAEVINSDKMQVYEGLDVTTNKITDGERAGVPHHLLGVIPPDADFSATEFRRRTTGVVECLHRRGKLPVIAGGSNSFVEALVDGDNGRFRSMYNCCFLWVDVSPAVLDSFVSDRVDKMVAAGMVEELRPMFRPDGDYSRGIRRAIGVPEMDAYFRAEAASADEATRERLLTAAVGSIKANTCELARVQRRKIDRLARLGWAVRRIDATEAFRRRGREAEEAWRRLVAGPSVEIVRGFLRRGSGGSGDGVGDGAAEWQMSSGCGAVGCRSCSTATATATAVPPWPASVSGAAPADPGNAKTVRLWGPPPGQQKKVNGGLDLLLS